MNISKLKSEYMLQLGKLNRRYKALPFLIKNAKTIDIKEEYKKQYRLIPDMMADLAFAISMMSKSE